MIYGSSQARDRIRAAAAGLCHSHWGNTGSELHLQTTRSLWQCQIFNPLSEARDQTHILMDTSQVLNPLSHNGNSSLRSFIYFFYFLFIYFFVFCLFVVVVVVAISWAAPTAYGDSQARG